MVFLLCVWVVASLWVWSLGGPLSPWSGLVLLFWVLPSSVLFGGAPPRVPARVVRSFARFLFVRLPWWWCPCPGSSAPVGWRGRLWLAVRAAASP